MLDSRATIDLSRQTPDYFSCQNCLAYENPEVKQPGHQTASRYGWADRCAIMQERGQCRAMMLAQALQTGAVQVHLVAPALLPAG